MAILDFLKKPDSEKEESSVKEIKKSAKGGAALAKKKTAPKEAKKEAIEEKKEFVIGKRKGFAPGHQVLISPHVTEKATDLNERNKYVFKISEESNKIEVKKAIEGVYGVNVIEVRIINIPRRKRRVGKSTGWVKGYKKAIIRIKDGQKIEILSH